MIKWQLNYYRWLSLQHQYYCFEVFGFVDKILSYEIALLSQTRNGSPAYTNFTTCTWWAKVLPVHSAMPINLCTYWQFNWFTRKATFICFFVMGFIRWTHINCSIATIYNRRNAVFFYNNSCNGFNQSTRTWNGMNPPKINKTITRYVSQYALRWIIQ